MACAITLARQGRPYLVLEKNPEVGGRVRTSQHGNFRLDHGFQVLLNSYPELPGFLDLDQLNLKKFHSGAMVFNGDKMKLMANPILHPTSILSGMVDQGVSFSDKTLILSLIAKSQWHRDNRLTEKQSTLSLLKDHGFSQDFIEFFWRPFLAGVFLDESLSVGSDYFLFLMRCFSLGAVTVPALGMGEIPKQMRAQLDPHKVRSGVEVLGFDARSVTLRDGEKIEASHVVCAFNPQTARERRFRKVTTLYFTCKEDPGWSRWLVLVPAKLGMTINHLCQISNVSPDLAGSEGEHLITVSVVGSKSVNRMRVESEIEQIAGRSLSLNHLQTFEIEEALPVLEGGVPQPLCESEIFYCGDHRLSPSIDGALKSGRLVAEAFISS